MPDLIGSLKRLLTSVRLFSEILVRMPLREYQVRAVDAVVGSCMAGSGMEFLWIFPRQSGKDEALAQMCAFLLALFQRVEACIVHVYPTSAQLATGIERLERRLENLLTAGRWLSKSHPVRRGLGLAKVAFFSGHPSGRSEGATANLLLIVNEAQDQVEAVIDRRFIPMRASSNATALFVGTVRTTSDYLWKTKERLEAAQAGDGKRRVFVVSPYEVGAENPHYLEFVKGQVAARGREHPSVKTEYFCEPVDVSAGLFPARRLALMLGKHERRRVPRGGHWYAALIDVGGQDEAAQGQALASPGRDYTVCTIVRVRRDTASVTGPIYEVVDVLVDQGSRHFEDQPGRASLFARLVAYLEHWGVVVAICDQTGVGQGLTDALRKAYKRRVAGFDFARAHGKARLGCDFLALVETGRFKYFRSDYQVEGSDSWWFFTQAEHCAYELGAGQPIERGMRWGVRPGQRVISSGGEAWPVHDDRLISAALCAELDRMLSEGQAFAGTFDSAVVRAGEERAVWA